MGIGTGLVLIGVGAILAFATNFDTPGLHLHVIGWILMLIGGASLALTVLYTRPRGRAPITDMIDESVFQTHPERSDPPLEARRDPLPPEPPKPPPHVYEG